MHVSFCVCYCCKSLDLSVGTEMKDAEEPDLLLGIFSPYATEPTSHNEMTISEAGADAIAFMIRNNTTLLKLE